MSTPDNFQSTYEWSQNYLRDPTRGPPNPNNSGSSAFSFLFIALLLVLAFWWWWIFYGSSIKSKKEVKTSVPKAGFDELKASLKNNNTKLIVKPNGMVTAN